MGDTLKEIYNLEYDPSEQGLPIWFNRLIDKKAFEINLNYVNVMLNQRILVDLAIDKALEFLKVNPFEGYYWDGQLLELLCKEEIEDIKKSSNYNFIEGVLRRAEDEICSYEWLENRYKEKFAEVLAEFKRKV